MAVIDKLVTTRMVKTGFEMEAALLNASQAQVAMDHHGSDHRSVSKNSRGARRDSCMAGEGATARLVTAGTECTHLYHSYALREYTPSLANRRRDS